MPRMVRTPGVVPVGVATLVGRDQERAEAAGLLTNTRLVTLTGAGGCGKTRLAAAVATDLAPWFNGDLWWVELGGVNDPGSVAASVAAATGTYEQPGRGLVDTLVEQLRGQRGLLVLDNCEHLLVACASLVTALLQACPRLTVLTTSREPLAVEGEAILPVPPLALPDPDARSMSEVAQADAARLFELRARQARGDFALTDGNAAVIAAICRRLDGIPLAIELAAARVRALSAGQIAEGLADRFRLLTGGLRSAPARHQTLKASITWSFDLLNHAEQLALARLSVFASTFDLEAAQAVVAGDGIDADDVLDLVAGLVDRSLLQVGERDGRARYRMLESVRLYAQERLAEMDDPARMRDRHLDAFIDLAKRARDGLAGPEAEAWTARLAADLDDLRAAMDWAAESQRPLAVLDIAEPTSRFWFDRGLYGEMGQRLQAAVDDPGATDIDRARGATTAALLAVGGGDLRTGYSLADRAVALTPATETSDARALGLGLRAYAGLISQLASYDQIRADVDEATLLAEGLGDSASRPHVLVFAGITEAYGGTLTASRRLLEHAVALCEDAEVLFHLPATHVVLGMWALFAGDLERCRTHIMQGSALGRRLRRSGWEAAGLAALAVADVVQGDERTAAARLAEARALTHGGGLTPFRLTVHRWTALVAYGSGDLVAARAAAVAARRTAHEWGSCWDEACAEWILGTLDSYEGRHADARARLERARELSVDPGYPFTLGRSLTGLAQLAQFDGDLLHAWELAHQSLEILAAYGDHIGVGDALETVAGLSAALGKPDQALRLLAAAKRFHADTGIGRFPLQADYYDRHVAAAQEQLSEDDATACWAEGASLTLMEAVAYVRRGRGERGRPETGWDSLTPAEHDLIRYVAEGCTNAQIGERLFISVNTVKKHLSRIYLKLGVEGRAELAAQVARRAS